MDLPLASVFDSLGGLNGLLGSASDVLELIQGLQAITLLDELVDLSELLDLTANQSSLSTTWSWFGLNEQTNIGNTYVNLDELTLSELVGNLGDTLDLGIIGNVLDLDDLLGGIGINLPGSLDAVEDLLSGLDSVSTPEVTAWIPAASGNYELPLGGSFGFLTAMPTIARVRQEEDHGKGGFLKLSSGS